MLVATVIVLFAAGFFAFRRSREIAGLDAPVDEPFILAWSVILYVLAVMLVFVASVHRNFLDNAAAQTQRSGTDDFLEEYQTRKKGVRR